MDVSLSRYFFKVLQTAYRKNIYKKHKSKKHKKQLFSRSFIQQVSIKVNQLRRLISEFFIISEFAAGFVSQIPSKHSV